MMMRRAVLTTLLVLAAAASAQAKMVHYTDEKGKIHYVNTDYAPVPARYRAQVKDQLASEEQAQPVSAETDSPAAIKGKASDTPPASDCRLTVMVLVDGNQAHVTKQLKERNIPFVVHDVGSEPGRTFYKNLGGGTLPVIQIMTATVLQGDAANDVGRVIDGLPACENRQDKKK